MQQIWPVPPEIGNIRQNNTESIEFMICIW